MAYCRNEKKGASNWKKANCWIFPHIQQNKAIDAADDWLCWNHFQEKNGSLICKEILGCEINTPDGMDYFSQNELLEKKCFQCVKSAAEILEELL